MDTTLYPLIEEATNALYTAIGYAQSQLVPPSEPPSVLLRVRSGLAESPGWFLAQAMEFDPEPLTVAYLRVRDIYAAESIVQAMLELMASEGWLDRRQEYSYYLTAEGRAVWQRSRVRRNALFSALGSQLQEIAVPLEVLLSRLILASMESAIPPGTWCLAHSRNRAPSHDAPVLSRLLQDFEDFNAFRDDAHMAAWQPLQISGGAWETFALVGSILANSVESLFEQLAHRGYAREDYALFLKDLEQREWLLHSETEIQLYSLTISGEAILAEVERLTDSYFYAPWSVLSSSEIDHLQRLLQQFCDTAAAINKEESSQGA